MRLPLFAILLVILHIKLVYSDDDSHDLPPKNYAAIECARVLGTNPEATNALHIISREEDDYMLNICGAKIWFVIELCEPIEATKIAIANYELFSSTFKNFTVYFSDTYPTLNWKVVGQFIASNTRTLQTFDLKQMGFGRFIRVELHSHHGNEHYCPISEVKVYGNSMIDEYEKEISPSKDKNITKKSICKTSALKAYSSMMRGDPWNNSSLLHYHFHLKNAYENKTDKTPPVDHTPSSITTSPPTQQPATNQSLLRPSVFVELSNKVKALETSSKLVRDDMGKRINETASAIEDIERQLQVLRREFVFIKMALIACGVYQLVLYLLSRW